MVIYTIFSSQVVENCLYGTLMSSIIIIMIILELSMAKNNGIIEQDILCHSQTLCGYPQ